MRSSAKIILIAGPMLTSALQALEKVKDRVEVVVIDDQQDLAEELRLEYVCRPDLIESIPVISVVHAHSLDTSAPVGTNSGNRTTQSQGYTITFEPRIRPPILRAERSPPTYQFVNKENFSEIPGRSDPGFLLINLPKVVSKCVDKIPQHALACKIYPGTFIACNFLKQDIRIYPLLRRGN